MKHLRLRNILAAIALAVALLGFGLVDDAFAGCRGHHGGHYGGHHYGRSRHYYGYPRYYGYGHHNYPYRYRSYYYRGY